MKFIVTDLTRFKKNDLLCMAGLTEDGKTCIRPLRSTSPYYLSHEICKNKGVLPGAILEGKFTTLKSVTAPHVEDVVCESMNILGYCTSQQFEDVLQKSSVRKFSDGFGMSVTDKVLTTAPPSSIITLAIEPEQLKIVAGFNGEGIKAHLTDEAKITLRYLAITDLGFYDYVGNDAKCRASIESVNRFIASQKILYIRLGLSRFHEAPDGRKGYWLQLNGIYTFPDYQEIIRKY